MINHDLKIIIIATPKVCSTSFSKTFGISHHHISMDQAKVEYAPYWKSYFKFAFVRNPMDKLISSFDGNVNGETTGKTLEELCFLLLHNPFYFLYHGFHPQSHYVSDPEELDFVGRYEHLDRDWTKLCQLIHFNMPLHHTNSSQHRLEHRKQYFTPQICAAVAQVYKKDFAMFDYDYPLPNLKD